MAAAVLSLVQAWLAEDALAASRLVVVTRRAVDAGPGEPVDVTGAPAWGLVRVAAAENPGRFVLADVDEVAGAGELIVAGAGTGRAGVRGPRRAAAGAPAGPRRRQAPGRT